MTTHDLTITLRVEAPDREEAVAHFVRFWSTDIVARFAAADGITGASIEPPREHETED